MILPFILGIIIGAAAMAIIIRIILIKKLDGYFIIDESDGNTQYIIDLHDDQDDLLKRKWMRLRVGIKET